jgi:hypothetical protein
MLREIVVNDERMALGVAEIFANRARRVRRDVEHRRGFGRRRCHHDGVFHGAVVFEDFDHLCNRRTLLPDRVVDADQVVTLGVQDRVDGNGGFSRSGGRR